MRQNGWLFNKRFALEHGTAESPKARVTDDCRSSGLKQCIHHNPQTGGAGR